MTHTTDLRIAPATPEDVPHILRFIKELADYEKLLHEVTGSEDDLRRELFGPDPVARVVIAWWQGAPAGYALYFFNFSTFLVRPGLYLEDLYVTPSLRGRGIGRALLAHLAAIAVARGCGRMEWSVLDWNEPSIGFYKSLGAVPMDEWTVFRLAGDALKTLGTPRD